MKHSYLKYYKKLALFLHVGLLPLEPIWLLIENF